MRKLKIKYRGDRPLSKCEEILSGKVPPTPEMLDSADEDIRATLAYIGYGLDVLVNDPSPKVRKNVTIHFHRLDILVNDPDPEVAEMARRKIEQLKREGL